MVLTARGISKKTILKYEEAVNAGKFLAIANGPESDVRRARDILAGSKPEQLEVQTETLRG